jgi:hypothetical protein
MFMLVVGGWYKKDEQALRYSNVRCRAEHAADSLEGWALGTAALAMSALSAL